MILIRRILPYILVNLITYKLSAASFLQNIIKHTPPTWKEGYYSQVLIYLSTQVDLEFSSIKLKNCILKNLDSLKENKEKEDYIKNIFSLYEKIVSYRENQKEQVFLKYRNLIFKLREIINSSYYQMNKDDSALEISFIQKVCFLLFTGVVLKKEKKSLEFNYNFVSPDDNNQKLSIESKLKLLSEFITNLDVSFDSFKDKTRTMTLITKRKLYEDYLGICTWGKFDPITYNQIVSVKFKAFLNGSEKKTILHIRMPTPTIGSNEKTQVSPEFKTYLEYLKKEQLRHLYINFQDRRSSTLDEYEHLVDLGKVFGVADESYRSKAIESLEDEFPENLKVLSLSKNNSLYLQNNKYKVAQLDKDYFLGEFLKELFSTKSYGYKIPVYDRKKSELKLDISHLLKGVLNTLFKEKVYLSRTDRKILMDIFYVFVVNFFSQDIHFMNHTCKDGVDRAGASLSLFYLFLLIDLCHDESIKNESFQRFLSDFSNKIFVDAILNKERHILKKHFSRFFEASLFIINSFMNNKDSKKLLRHFSQKLTIR